MNSREEDVIAETVERWTAHLSMFDVRVDPDQPLGEVGLDSLTAAELSGELEEAFGVVVPMDRFLGEKTLREVATELQGSQALPEHHEPSHS